MKVIINTPTPSVEQSIKFYSDLNFHCTSISDYHYAISGDLKIRINHERLSRAGMVFYNNDWSEFLNSYGEERAVESKDNRHFIADPNGIILELCNSADYPTLPDHQSEVLTGNFSGISIEAFDFKQSIAFWTKLGYKKTMGNEDSGWIAMSNDTPIGISLMKFNMCPHLFFNPSFTYFNSGKNLEVIQRIREANIQITEEITLFNKEGLADNIIIRDPGGFGFFVFND